MVIRHLLETILNPFFVCLLLFAFLLALLWLCGNTRIVRWGFLLVLVLLLIFSTGWLPSTLTHQLEDRYPVIKKVDPDVHWVVVLSGGQSEVRDRPVNTLLSSASLKRLLEGVRLYRQLPRAKLLLSGGGYGFETPEAQRLAQIASWFAIPATDMILETTSINTADQAKAIKPLVHEERFYLVTSAIHMPRSMKLFLAQGLHPIPAPTDYTYFWDDERWRKMFLPNPYNLFYLSIALHELLGTWWSKLHHDYARS
ncbi:membrane protein [Legionella lansingensis]|uniref:Membrane protein n=1 Tax=Legionella lansingensis TaxID=45067 RepID=A0A0W0VN40_9GAMM|nr:ElyC/SanA/YdcF family protein [Legionella lansingensis]KTD21540.1 membrane protein [Legionella lansingensis]SNV52508.1 membrane protein [Legionella lansingensis]